MSARGPKPAAPRKLLALIVFPPRLKRWFPSEPGRYIGPPWHWWDDQGKYRGVRLGDLADELSDIWNI